jgi:2-dehydro-3-deoxygluconokinase
MARIVLVGEGMVELSRADAALWRLTYGGDTLNTAIHLARFGDQVGFLTALGDDPFSADLRAAWMDEGIDPALLLTKPASSPGLYAITNDAEGERSFTYWRKDSAATHVFTAPGIAEAVRATEEAEMLGFSLISLAILPPEGRDALLDVARRMRAAGRHVAFDGNYRARLWTDAREAALWRDRAIATCTIGLPTLEDEAQIGHPETPEEIAARWQAGGATEVVVKLGVEGCFVAGKHVPPPTRLAPHDTSGAGDAFNAGYLHARLAGYSPAEAARIGHRIAGWVVMRVGAVPPRDTDAPYAP